MTRKRAPGAGRPSVSGTVGKGRSPRLVLSLTPELDARLRLCATREQASAQDVAREALGYGLEQIERHGRKR